MTTNSFHWAFVGCGNIALKVGRKILKSKRHIITAVYGRTKHKTDKIAKALGAKAYDRLLDAVCAPNVQGVYIAVTHDAHFELAKQVIALGKPVLVEKPLTVNAQQAKQLEFLAKQNSVYLCEAMWTWFSPMSQQIKESTHNQLGRILNCELSFCMPLSFNKNSRVLSPLKAGGALLDLGVYPLCYAYKLFGKPLSLTCKSKIKYDIDIQDWITLAYPSFTVRITLAVNSFLGKGEQLCILGENGKICSKTYHSGKSYTAVINGKKMKYSFDDAMVHQFDCVAKEIVNNETQSAFMPLDDSIEVLKMIDLCRAQNGIVYPFE